METVKMHRDFHNTSNWDIEFIVEMTRVPLS